jgi:hypothetical protein
MLVYATEDDLANWLTDTDQEPPANAGAVLRSASILVARAIRESLYADGVVTSDPKRDATCAQVYTWMTTGIAPSSAGLSSASLVRSKSIDGATIEYDTSLNASVTAFNARQALADGLCAESMAILDAEQLLYAPTPQWSAEPDAGQFVNEFDEVSYNRAFDRLWRA